MKCGNRLTGYEVKAKNRHYYKCNRCKGVSINADTSERMKNRKGAHNMFIELISSYKLDDAYLDLFKLQMKKILNSTGKSQKSEEAVWKQQLTVLKRQERKVGRKVCLR